MADARRPKRIAAVDDIPAWGMTFAYMEGPFEEEGILLRLADGSVRAYKNECRHLPMRLDQRAPHSFWDLAGETLQCTAHGARYRLRDGLCVAGPCEGSHLKSLPVEVSDGEVWLDEGQLGSFFDV